MLGKNRVRVRGRHTHSVEHYCVIFSLLWCGDPSFNGNRKTTVELTMTLPFVMQRTVLVAVCSCRKLWNGRSGIRCTQCCRGKQQNVHSEYVMMLKCTLKVILLCQRRFFKEIVWHTASDLTIAAAGQDELTFVFHLHVSHIPHRVMF